MAAVIERQSVRVRPTGAALDGRFEGVDLAGRSTPEARRDQRGLGRDSFCVFAARASRTTI